MKIAIGCDHAGYELKEIVKDKLTSEGYGLIDLGTNSSESVDYPIYGRAVGEKVASGECDKGIAICGTGIGISISCNKVKGVRAALCNTEHLAKMSREHNDANVLCLGAREIDKELALKIVDKWLSTDFLGGKHLRRIKMLEE